MVRFHRGVYSGEKPNPRQLSALKNVNVNTVICVDGAPPDVHAASSLNIETIHIPMHYGMPSEETREQLIAAVHHGLTKGGVYIHCHYGKHRSAAAAGIALLGLNLADRDVVKSKMELSGTSKNYTGLWLAVELQEPLPAIPENVQFVELVLPEGITKNMIAMNRAFERLEEVKNNGWNVPSSHPDLAPAADAGFIAEMFRSLQLSDEVNQYPQDFESLVVNAMHHASGLEQALLQNAEAAELNRYLNRVEMSCIYCHDAHRSRTVTTQMILQ